MSTSLKCPVCKKVTSWEDNPWRPFCCERCKLIDLGDWADEKHRIPGATVYPQLEDESDTENGFNS